MNSVYELLAQKEQDLLRVNKEVECLRIAAPLLDDQADEGEGEDEGHGALSSEPPASFSVEETEEESAVKKVMGIFRKRSA